MAASGPVIRKLGRTAYEPTWRAMQAFTQARRHAPCADECWLTEHEPVYTLGLAGDPAHLLQAQPGIALVRCDRGGQITYHGPGQAILYPLLDLRRYGLKVREFVHLLEQCVIEVLADAGIIAARRAGMPGVYVDEGRAKIAALGLKVVQGCCYHGIALNVAMDLQPFAAINPCGYADLAVTQTSALGAALDLESAQDALLARLLAQLAARNSIH